MVDFFAFADNLKSYPIDSFLNNLSDEIESNEDTYKLELEEQWDNGKDGNDNLFPRYAVSTAEFYAKINPPIKSKVAGQPYNLMWSGEMFAKTYLKADNKGNDILITVDSTSKTKDELFNTRLKNMANPFDTFKLNKAHLDEFTLLAQNLAYELLNKNLL